MHETSNTQIMDVKEQDPALLANLDNPFGNKQELKKKFSFLSMLGLAFVILTTWTSMASSMSIALPSGGPVAVLYGLIASGIGSLAVAVSLAEICSTYPTNGAQYEWTAVLAPRDHQRYLSYICGWILVASWWALAATGPSLFGSLSIGFIKAFNPDYIFRKWHQFLIYVSVEVCAMLINTFATAALPLLSKLAFYVSITGLFSISIALLALSKDNYQPASFVFAGFINTTGWSDGTAWLLGLLQSCFSLTAFDAVAHLVEEMPHPRRDAPRTMILAVILGTVTAFIFCVCVLFSIRDLDEVISSDTGPIVTIFQQATGSVGGAVGMAIPIMAIVWFSAAEVVTASARLTAAFARHGGLPFGQVFSHVNTKLDLPLNAMLLTNVMVIIFGCIYLATSSAFEAIVSACVVGLNSSYAFPIGLLVFRGRKILPKGPMHLGRWGYPLNVFSLLFLIVTNVLFLFPSHRNPTGDTMNYAIVAIAAVVLMASIYWIFYARKHYGPPSASVVGSGLALDILEGINDPKVYEEERLKP